MDMSLMSRVEATNEKWNKSPHWVAFQFQMQERPFLSPEGSWDWGKRHKLFSFDLVSALACPVLRFLKPLWFLRGSGPLHSSSQNKSYRPPSCFHLRGHVQSSGSRPQPATTNTHVNSHWLKSHSESPVPVVFIPVIHSSRISWHVHFVYL